MKSKFKWIFSLLLALSMQIVLAQEKTVTGVVSDATGSLPGANVVVRGTTRGAQTNLDGKYSIKVSVGEVLVFTFIGMESISKTVGASNSLNVSMTSGSASALLDVVVVGYRTVTKKTAVTAAATVNSETIENRPNANVLNTIQGQLAGVNITASTGQPGAKSTVIIRGAGTINGNTDPLYVIDGFPSNSDNFRTINPNDIASLDVLKDAAAISQYGSRGSNGVIVITTKTGSYGAPKTTFRYSSQYGVSQLQTPRYSYANSKELLKIEQNFGAGRGSNLSDAEIAAYSIDTDWVDYFFNQSNAQTHNFSIENNSKNINSFTSASFFDQQGVLESTGLKRFTVRNNLNGKSEDGKFNFSVNSSFGHSNNNEATNLGTGAINRNYVTGAYLGAPYISPDEYENSQQLLDLYFSNGTLLYTPLFLVDKLNTYVNSTEETRIDLATELSYKFVDGLTGRVRTSGQLLQNRFHQAENPGSWNALLFLRPGQVFGGFEDINERREFLFNNLYMLDYNKTFGKHAFNLVAASEYNYSRLNTNNFRQNGLDPKLFVPNTGEGYIRDTSANDFYVPGISASSLRNDLISYFTTFDYDFNRKYGFAASYRIDGSSRFIEENQWNNFWSLGGRWNIDEEEFMQSLSFIDVLKLRGSIGTSGNQRIVDGSIYAGINPPAFADIYPGTNNAYNNGTGYGLNLGFPALRWETTEQYNIGVDFELLRGRVRGSFDHYNKKTIDLFLSQPLVPATGATLLTVNSDAFITNKGFELNIAYDVIKNNNLTLTVRANGSVNDNKVGGIIANKGEIINGNTITKNGGSINEPYVYHYLGVNSENGNLLFEDKDGNPTESPVGADRKALGKNNLPRYQGGFGFDLDYKGFFMSSTFTFAQDVVRYDFDLSNLYSPGNIGTFNVTDDLLNAWTATNTGSNIPSLRAANLSAQNLSDRFIKDASYVRLRNVQVGYRVPKEFLAKTFLTDVSFTLQGENLFNITKWQGFDPESSRVSDVYQYPTAKQFTFGVDLKF